MKGKTRSRLRLVCPLFAAALAGVMSLPAAAAPMPLTQGSVTNTAGYPTGMSPDAKMNQFAVTVTYFLNGKDASGGLGMATVPVPNIPTTAGLPKPTAAQVAAASAAKAMAIVNAVNAAKLPGVSAMVNMQTVKGMYNTGNTMQVTSKLTNRTYTVPVKAPADFTTFTVSGVRQSVNPNNPNGPLGTPLIYGAVDKNGKPTNANPTAELGDAKGGFMPAGKAVGMLGTDTGTGALASAATGLDPSGGASIVGFGFIDNTTSTPTDYFESIEPEVGMTDEEVLSGLADLFNQDYSTDGFTASYDPSHDILSIDELLPAVDEVWSENSDTGLALESNTVVPEPAALTLLAAGGMMMALRRRRGARGIFAAG